MTVKDVMTRAVRTVDASATIEVAAKMMRNLDVGPLPVVEGGDVIGILTDRDIVVRGVAAGLPFSAPVRAVMTKQVFFCFEDEPIEQAVQVMQSKQIRRLVVLGADRKLVGILALADLARYTAEDLVTDVVEEVSQPVTVSMNPDAGRMLETIDFPAE